MDNPCSICDGPSKSCEHAGMKRGLSLAEANAVVGNGYCRERGQAHRARNCFNDQCKVKGFCVRERDTWARAEAVLRGESEEIVVPQPCVSRPPIIALSGKAGSGKDTLGRELLKPMGYSQFALAWHMKNEACGHYFNPATGDGGIATYEEVHHTKPKDIREFLQWRGTEGGWKKYGQHYWLNIAEAWMRTLRENCGLEKFFLTDARFPHEVQWVQRLGGVVIRITGRGGLEGERANHSSETALDNYTGFDGFLDNSLDNDWPNLRRQLNAILQNVRE